MKTRFYLKKQNGSPEGFICFIFTVNFKQERFATGLKCKIGDWENGFIKESENKEVSEILKTYKTKINTFIIHTIKCIGRPPVKKELKQFIDVLLCKNSESLFSIEDFTSEKVLKEENTLVSQIENLIKEYLSNTDIGKKAINRKCGHLKMFVDWLKKENEIKKINYETLKQYRDYLSTTHKNWQVSNLNNCLKSLRAFFLWCWKNERIDENLTMYINLWSEAKKTNIIALNQDEIKTLQSAMLIPRLRQAVDLFLFSCYTGLKYNDIKCFNKNLVIIDEKGFESIQMREIDVKNFVIIPIIPQCKEILDKYNYNLPIISLQKINEYLKESFKLLNLNRNVQTNKQTIKGIITEVYPLYKVISFNKARDLFITQMLLAKIPIEVVEKISRCKKIKCQEYVIPTNIINNAMQKFSKNLYNFGNE